MGRNRGSKPEEKGVEKIKIDPAGKYVLLCKGLSNEQITLLRFQLGQFFIDPTMSYFILGISPEVDIQFEKVKGGGDE